VSDLLLGYRILVAHTEAGGGVVGVAGVEEEEQTAAFLAVAPTVLPRAVLVTEVDRVQAAVLLGVAI
jgi:hypothetical protein